MHTYPHEVTDYNWEELQQQGFRHLTNTRWSPAKLDIAASGSSYELLLRIKQMYGDENVKEGYMLYQGVPSFSHTKEYQMVGIYVKAT
jgi:hypothetical protein